MGYFLIDDDQLRALENVQRRLHSEERMYGEEMRDLGHKLESVVRVCRELELPEEERTDR
jgi:hypothetical protein